MLKIYKSLIGDSNKDAGLSIISYYLMVLSCLAKYIKFVLLQARANAGVIRGQGRNELS
jgi:hypothetical protein